MKTQTGLTEFDFNNIWDISSEQNNGYPHLRSFIPTVNDNIDVEILSYDGSNISVYSNTTHNDVFVVIAAYEEGKLIDLKTTSADLAADTTSNISIPFSHTNNIKIFIWKSDTSMVPFSEKFTQ